MPYTIELNYLLTYSLTYLLKMNQRANSYVKIHLWNHFPFPIISDVMCFFYFRFRPHPNPNLILWNDLWNHENVY